MRYRFISDLVKELLGPRNGSNEQFLPNEDPRNEYATGQLFPRGTNLERAPEEEESLAADINGGEEDENEAPQSFVNQALIDAGQNFRRIPSSLGLSFVLKTMPRDGEIRVCVTWGRYQLDENGNWARHPNYWIDEYIAHEIEKFSADGSLSLSYKLGQLPDGSVKVSIYLLSNITLATDNRVTSDEIIFQPELRVNLKKSENIAELGDLGFITNDKEWRISTRQYDNLKVFARGHLCGVYWKDIDPQRDHPLKDKTSNVIPFFWTDGNHFINESSELKDFLLPDFRTEFIPLYSAPAPVISNSDSSKIELDAEKMAECSNIQALSHIISPLVDEYSSWINDLQPIVSADNLDQSIIGRHAEALKRIKEGVNFLETNDEAFHAFLFMNKAMALQYKWGKSPTNTMKWRPFQLAFILLSLKSTVDKNSDDRNICDTIWFPTGGGKTEAYLGLAAFAMAYRRRTASEDTSGSVGGEGVCVISRYTLRLLTIQQFRRALKMIMACEMLRCQTNNGNAGWNPARSIKNKGMIWGRSSFSIGLWVGSKVTPNAMKGEGWKDISAGAVPLLKKPAQSAEADPAQIIECPVCSSMLSMPIGGIRKGKFIYRMKVNLPPRNDADTMKALETPRIEVTALSYSTHKSQKCGFLTLDLNLKESLSAIEFAKWWEDKAQDILNTKCCSLNVSRPGYFPIESKRGVASDYEIRCPNLECELNAEEHRTSIPKDDDEWEFAEAHPLFQERKDKFKSMGIPINAITVDEKLYCNPPSMLIATCDKFATMAFDNKTASLFGRVRSYANKGYSQEKETTRNRRFYVDRFLPPSLIIQDELHLLEGPLGSSFGLYETAIDTLCESPKYIASSATIRNSAEQVAALLSRENKIFPPPNLDIANGFFLKSEEAHPLDERRPGRLFLGLAFPGRAPQTPMLRLWGRLLQSAQNLKDEGDDVVTLDYFWTLVGYFNAVRELAQGETLLRQDIPQYLDKLQRQNPQTNRRQLPPDGFENLSSQTDSSRLPGILTAMERKMHQADALDTVATTSMFGTGVDVSRLSMMIVHGQPKSASQYIQAVGRIGREKAGLAAVFFRVSKPRDLNHYEYFTGYHRKLPVAVEPITVKPLSPKALDRTIGALLATFVRNWGDDLDLPDNIDTNDGAGFANDISTDFIKSVLEKFAEKWENQPEQRRPPNKEKFVSSVLSKFQRWQEYSRKQNQAGQVLYYSKNGALSVLGSNDRDLSVFPNVPRSLREVEPTISIYTRDE